MHGTRGALTDRPTTSSPGGSTTGLLLSGGLDSAILLGHLVEQGHRVQPFYIRSGFVWQDEEHRSAVEFTRAIGRFQREPDQLRELVVLDMPVGDLYEEHWSLTGRDTPGYETPDEAVFLMGHNPLLLLKAALWCRMRGIPSLALASLCSNPFGDATSRFFTAFEKALYEATGGVVQIVRPFEHLDKRDVMQLGRRYPVELSFSCLAPVDRTHCGKCNKCAERQAAFQWLPTGDPTHYASSRYSSTA